MPDRSKPLWILTAALLVGTPALWIVYWWQVLASGSLPHDGDAVAIPMFAGVVTGFLASPLVLATAWFCLRRYDPRTRLLAWRGDRPVRSVAATLVFGGPALVLTAGLLHDLILGVEPLHEYILVALRAPWIAWLLAMRAALVGQRAPAAGDDGAPRPISGSP